MRASSPMRSGRRDIDCHTAGRQGGAALVSSSRRRSAVGLLAWAWVCACDSTGLPSGAQRFSPPSQYRAWWSLTEACSGLRGNFNNVAWYIDRRAETFSLEGAGVNGAWYGGNPNRIVLGDSEEFDGTLVRHEMLHALLGSAGHPRQQFLANCGDIVVCVERCVADAGGPPDTSETAAILDSTALPAAILIAPDTVSLSADSGWITITVSVTNVTSSPGLVPVAFYGPNQSYPITIVNYGSTPAWSGLTQYQMDYYITVAPNGMAGSTRRVVFDHQIAAGTASQYVIKGLFSESTPPTQVLTVAP